MDHFRYSRTHLLCVAFATPTLTLSLGEYLIEDMLSDWEVSQTPNHRHRHNNGKEPAEELFQASATCQ